MFGLKKKGIKQDVYIVTAKGVAEREKLDTGITSAALPDYFQAWEIDYNQQAEDEHTGQPTQFVSSLNQRPLIIYKSRPQLRSTLAAVLAVRQFDEKLTQIHEQQQKQSMLLWLGIIIMALLVLIGIVILAGIM